MKEAKLVTRAAGAISLATAIAFMACTDGSAHQPPENVGEARSEVFANGDFEMGTNGNPPPSWTVNTYLNPGITLQTPQTRAGLNLMAGGHPLTTIVTATNQPEPDLGPTASLRLCRFGAQCAVVNFHSSTNYGNPNNGKNVNSLSQTMTIGAGDVDPADGQVHVRFAIAPVLQNPNHTAVQQPYYFVQLTNVTTSTVLYTDFNLSAQAGVPWKTMPSPTGEIDYVDWALVDIAPGSSKVAMGDQVNLEIIAAGCSPGGHTGAVYVDGIGSAIPGLFITGTGPAQANAGSNITYTLNYKNGSSTAETGAVIDFTTPPGTTFQSITPPPGAVCATPAVGMAGTIVCTFAGPIPAGAAGSMMVTVNIDPAATGSVVCGTYDIQSATESPLLGNKVTTEIGCNADTDCSGGNWCHESAPNACDPKLANGTAIPNDPPHTGPTLNGTCTAAAGTLVCASGVCDTADNECGYANGDGTCNAGNAGTVCRSGVCDPDLKCGYALGDGPCTVANGGTVCRSGACSTNGKCEPAGGCNVDADCTGGNWCNETAHACTPKLANGTPVPIDAPHTNPTLNGTCTAMAATLVCVSGVCDTTDNDCGYLNGDGPCTAANGGTVCRSGVCDPDLKCGYADGDGPCTAANGGTVCRSGACSTNGKCEPMGGCNVDADCTGGKWCNESAHVCAPKLTNGADIPTDAPHTAPTLDGTCTAAAAALVCQSGVCDAIDDKCGYADGDGPCDSTTGGTVCRSGACSADGTCEPAGGCNVDADCTGGKWCNETAHMCVVKLDNGTPIPTDAPHAGPTLDGTCTAAAGALVCASGVCDTSDDKCGYAVGDGPCDATNADVVCRSGACSTDGTCEPAGGCNVDADCTGGNWCNESAHMCMPKLDNGTSIPTDGPHMGPTLDGTCSVDAGTLVCASGVCDTSDDKCGYANGDGPCTAADGATVCRSTICATTGANQGNCVECVMDSQCTGAMAKCNTGTNTCVGGCLVDSDCAAGSWCNETAHMCTPKVANGMPLPTDSAHTSPTLDGTCTVAAAMVVCQTGVCDAKDNECGLADGDGPCIEDEQCRSNMCDTASKTCGKPGCMTDQDCPAADFCRGSDHACTPKLPIGSACDASNECQGGDCADKVCSSIIGSGNGLLCAARDAGSESHDSLVGIVGLMLAAAGLSRARQRASKKAD